MNTPGGKQDMAIVNLPGLYALLLAMQPEKARGVSDEYIAQRQAKLKAFRRWVTHEVLPSIHKHGAYMTEATIDRVISDPDFGIKLLQTLKDERAKNAVLTETISVQTQQITEMQPKASYYDVVLNCKDALSITTIAKDYGKSAKWMNEKLHELGVQFKQGGIWHLYQKYAEDGYTCTKTHNHPGSDGEIHAKNHTYWTQKGRFFLYELLKENGYVPVMERQLTAA
jgi:phage antirepressor YoqD-like protein